MTFADQAGRARIASRSLAVLTRSQKDAALHAMADALAAAVDAVLSANAVDVEVARQAGTSESLVDRLCLTGSRVDGMVAGLRSLAGLPDPVGDVVRGWTNANGVRVRQVRVLCGGLAAPSLPTRTVATERLTELRFRRARACPGR